MASPVFWGVAGVSAVAAFVMLWMIKFQSFHGKTYYALTFVAMIWTLLMVGSEAASSSFSCQFQWATLAWLGNALVPVAWCFFVFAYVDSAPWLGKRRVKIALVGLPVAVFAFAATNPWHQLVYTDASVIPPGEVHINFSHGPGFYAIIATLYLFVLATLFCLMRALVRAKRAAWPLLAMLVVITLTPLITNAAYVGLGFTVFGLDPTAFMFTLGVLAFTWLLVTNKTMDMASVGQSILFNTMSEPVILIDTHQNIVLMNTAAKSRGLHLKSGGLASDILPMVDRLNSSEDIAHLCIEERFYEPRIQEIENPINPTGAALGWSITFVDITDRIAVTSALEEALKRADDASRAKDEFISVVSHELRTPLTSLKGGLALALSGRVGELAVPVRKSLEIAHRNGARLSRLIDNILLAQKLDINALSLEHAPVELGSLLKESLEENKMFAAEQGLQLITSNLNQTAIVSGDAFAIRQIVDNLISNAIKFSPENCVVEGMLTISNGRVRLSVKDTGRGIPENMEDQVFGRFEQVKNGGQHATQGSGLGLHISRELAKQMSGKLFYESQVDVGTTFHIEFQLLEQSAVEPMQLAG